MGDSQYRIGFVAGSQNEKVLAAAKFMEWLEQNQSIVMDFYSAPDRFRTATHTLIQIRLEKPL